MGLWIKNLKEITLSKCKILKVISAFYDLQGFVFNNLIKFNSMLKKMIDYSDRVVLSRAVRSGVSIEHPEKTG